MSKSIITVLTSEIAKIFTPLQKLNDYRRITSFVNELGWKFDDGVELPLELHGLVNSASSLLDKITELFEAQQDEEKLKIALETVEDIKYLINSVNDVVPQIKTAIESIPDFIGEADDISEKLFSRLLDYLIFTYCQRYHPQIFAVFHILGVLGIHTDGAAMLIRTVYWERIPKLFYDPQDIFKTVYSWNDGSNNINSEEFFSRLEVFMLAFLLPGGIYTQKDSIREEFGRLTDDNKEIRMPIFQGGVWPDSYMELDLNLCPIPSDGDKKAGLALYPYFFGRLDIKKELAENWDLELGGVTEQKDTGICLKLRAPHDLELLTNFFTDNPFDNFTGAFKVGIIRTSSPDSMIYIFGSEKGSHLALKEAGVTFKASSQRDTPELSATLNVKEFTISINPGSDADGFIQKLLTGINIKSISELGIGVSNIQGVYFEGSSGLEIKIPTHLDLGPINIVSAIVGLSVGNSDFELLLASDFSANLGPLFAGVERMGLTIPLSIPEDRNGNLGPVQIESPKFLPPEGVALAIDAGVVKGAGYLFFDRDRGEYAGALELTFQDFLSLKAIGLIATKMPDGSKGFSLLIIITAEFTIQIGMGFVFLGAGGLLGLHRTAKINALADGVRSGTTTNLLFPKNIVENAPQIISDIRIFFPIQENYFLIGPMIKLGWGNPPLITISLGIIIEIKENAGGNLERIAILGVLKCILPEEKSSILVLQVNFIGEVDFTKKTGFFFASIFESRIMTTTIEGQMGVLVAWGDDSNFVVSVGGLHPRFNPPPLPFPMPNRISLNILNESWGKIRAEGYFAVTTNTAQFGAKIEVKFGFSKFKIDGHLAFDALFQFNPFYFIVEISGKVSLKVFGAGVFSVSLKLSLEGPTPWRAKGYGKIKILFFSFKARFDERWGRSRNTTLPPIEVMPVLYKEFNNIQNWEAIAPAERKMLVTLRDLPQHTEDTPDIILLHPVGRIRISQRAIILEKKIDLVGSQKPSDANYFELSDPNDNSFEWSTKTQESFPPAQYFEMESSKKLSEPATRKYVSGGYLEAKDAGIKTHISTVRHVRYELVTIDDPYKENQRKGFLNGLQVLFNAFLKNNAASKSVLGYKAKKESQPFANKIKVMEGNYTVANIMNNKPVNKDSVNFKYLWEAEAFLESEVKKDPSMSGALHIIPNNEVNVAA